MTRYRDYVEYDAYMRPVCKLGRCHYKGGGGSSTTIQKRDIPNQSAQEAALEKELIAYQNTGLAGAKDLQGRALDYINKTYNPDWTQLYNQYNGDINAALQNYQNTGDKNLNAYTKALQGNQDWFAKTSQDYAGQMKADSDKNLDAFNSANSNITNDYKNEQNTNLDSIKQAQADAIHDYDARSKKDNDTYKSDSKYNQDRYDEAMELAKNKYGDRLIDAGRKYAAIEDPASKDYQNGMASVNSGMADVSNGKLAGDYATNRRAALQDDLDSTTGSLLSNMARRGIINSSVMSNGLDSINQSTSDTLAKNYSADLAQQAGLLGNRGSLLQNTYATAHGKATDERNNAQTLATNGYGMSKDVADKDYTISQGVSENVYKNASGATSNIFTQSNANAKNVYDAANAQSKSLFDANLNNNANAYKGATANTNNYYDTLNKNMNTQYAGKTADAGSNYQAGSTYAGNLLQARQSTANNVLQGAAQSQINSYYAPSKMLDYAQNLYLPAQNQYNTMYAGRMGSAGTTSTTSKPSDNSMLWGAAGQLGSAAIIACFTGDTLVAVPGGTKAIKDIKAGDTVLSLDDDDRICKRRVLAVNRPVIQPIVDVEFENGAIWHTTDSQRAYTAPWFEYVERAKKPAVTMDGKSKIVKHERTDKQEFVYDFVVEDRNIFFANGIAAEGFGD